MRASRCGPIHDPRTATTASVLGNTTPGAWPVAELLLDQFGIES